VASDDEGESVDASRDDKVDEDETSVTYPAIDNVTDRRVVKFVDHVCE